MRSAALSHKQKENLIKSLNVQPLDQISEDQLNQIKKKKNNFTITDYMTDKFKKGLQDKKEKVNSDKKTK